MSDAQILIVDDCKLWRETVRSMLNAIPRYEVVGEAADAREAIQKAGQLHSEIVLLDIGMPILNGIEAAPMIRRASPHSKIVFVTQESDQDVRTAALATGAEGYLLKSRVASELIPTMDAIVQARRASLQESNVPSPGHDVCALARDWLGSPPFLSSSNCSSGTTSSAKPQARQTLSLGNTQTMGLSRPFRPGKWIASSPFRSFELSEAH